jgi:hypothetical protein
MDTQPQTDKATCPTVSRRQMSLAQLLLWLMATCVILAYEQWRLKTGDNQSEAFRWYFNIQLIFFAPLEGACLAAIVLCFWNLARRESRFPKEPGHWFLVTIGARNVCGALQEVINYAVGEETFNALPEWLSVIYGSSAWIVSCIVAMIAARLFRQQPLWSAAFVLIVIDSLLPILQSLLYVSFGGNSWFLNATLWGFGSRIVYSLPAVFIVWAAISEWSRGHRDLLHWFGVAVMLLLIAAEWPVWLVWLRLFR